MKKLVVLSIIIILVLSILTSPVLSKDEEEIGQPFKELWDAIDAIWNEITSLWAAIDEIELTPGPPGIHCWDLNSNGICDIETEDINEDGVCDVLDCRGECICNDSGGEVGPEANLVAFWKFDEGSGTTAYDSSSNENDGALKPLGSEPAWTTDCKSGGCLNFNGSQCIEVGDNDSLTPSLGLTISAWVYINQLPTDRTAIVNKYFASGNDRAYLLELGKAGNPNDRSSVCLTVSQSASPFSGRITCGTTQLEVGKWYHVAATFEANHQEVYVDGVEEVDDTNGDIADSIPNNNQPLYIGYHKDEGSYFTGIIDEVAIFDRALTADEISGIYESGIDL